MELFRGCGGSYPLSKYSKMYLSSAGRQEGGYALLDKSQAALTQAFWP